MAAFSPLFIYLAHLDKNKGTLMLPFWGGHCVAHSYLLHLFPAQEAPCCLCPAGGRLAAVCGAHQPSQRETPRRESRALKPSWQADGVKKAGFN